MAVSRIVVFLQENKTTDFYFPTLAAWGAVIGGTEPLLANPPDFDQPHDRNAWVHYAMGDYPAQRARIDNDRVIPYYSWLAKTFTFADHHFALGSNSTSGHMLAIGGQTPTLKNPPFVGAGPVWDLPSIFTVADGAGVDWAAFPDENGYPTKFYKSLTEPPGNEHVHRPEEFISLARSGQLPPIVYVWSPAGYDEHPPMLPDPSYISQGENLVHQRVQAVIDGGGWDETVFILTWDDWGGYADSVPTPSIETVPDALHPAGFQVIGGSRIPLLMFGGAVAQGIDSAWHSHASIPKTIIDLLGLPPIGIDRVDTAPSLAGNVAADLHRPVPPAPGATIKQPAAPQPPPTPVPPAPWSGPLEQPMPPIQLRDGTSLPPPTDGVVHPTPPKPPKVPTDEPPSELERLEGIAVETVEHAYNTLTRVCASVTKAIRRRV